MICYIWYVTYDMLYIWLLDPNFRGIVKSYDKHYQIALATTSTSHKELQESPTDETLKRLKELMQIEIEFYDLVKTRYEHLKEYYLDNGNLPMFLLDSVKTLNIDFIGNLKPAQIGWSKILKHYVLQGNQGYLYYDNLWCCAIICFLIKFKISYAQIGVNS